MLNSWLRKRFNCLKGKEDVLELIIVKIASWSVNCGVVVDILVGFFDGELYFVDM